MDETTPSDFSDALEMLRTYFPVDEIPTVERRITDRPDKRRRSPGPRNEKGYRADSFDDRGDYNIAYLGCSWTEGIGVSRGQIFTDLTSRFLSERTGLSVRSWNLGLGGMGIDYLTRLSPSVCASLRPDLIVVVISGADRREYFSEDGRRLTYTQRQGSLNGHSRFSGRDRPIARALHLLGNDFEDLAHLLRHLRALQATFDSFKIPWVFSWVEMEKAAKPMRTLLAANALPRERYLGRHFERFDRISEQDSHPGPESHRLFAKALVGWILRHDLPSPDKSRAPGDLHEKSPTRHIRRSAFGQTLHRLLDWKDRLRGRGRRGRREQSDHTDDIYPIW